LSKGLHEFRHGVALLDNLRRTPVASSEVQNPHWPRISVPSWNPHTQADPELEAARRYTNLSAAEVRQALLDRAYAPRAMPKGTHAA